MRVAFALRFAALAASLWIAAGPAQGAAIALVTDLRGEARSASGAKVAFLSELPADARLVLDKAARVTLIYVASGTEFSLAGPGEFAVHETEVKALSGTPPARRSVVARPDPVVVSRIAESATASIRMRSASTGKPASPRPALLYPRAAPIATLQPTLLWSADAPAAGFTVLVLGADGKPAWRGETRTTSIRVGARLSPSARYTWMLNVGDATIGETTFETLSADAIRRADASRAAAKTFSDRILHAFLLQDIGAAQDARQAWIELARERPDLPELAVLAR